MKVNIEVEYAGQKVVFLGIEVDDPPITPAYREQWYEGLVENFLSNYLLNIVDGETGEELEV